MKKIRGIFWVVASALLALNGTSAAAQAVDEIEPNYAAGTPDPMSAAQSLTFVETYDPVTSTVTRVATVNALMGSGDADIFSFPAIENDVVTVDIDDGAKSG